jgi:YbgC/YbaW family acyl-CoA thioester hydrolase
MHMLLRTLWVFLTRRNLPKARFDELTRVSMRVLPVDLDLLWHVNNGMYFSFMDFGRWNAIFRNGAYDLALQKKWYSVVVGETIKFKRSLQLWDVFTIETRIIGYDAKDFFISQKFFCKEKEMASGLVKVRFLKKSGGSVTPAEVMAEFEHTLKNEAQDLSSEWLGLEKKYLS